MSASKKFLAACLALVASTSALAAADPSVSATLVPINTVVTLSRPAGNPNASLVTYAAYRLTVTNRTTNDLNRIFLNATASNVGGTDPVLWDSSIIGVSPDPCVGYGTSTLSCETNISLPPGGGSVTFIVIARAPKNGSQIRIDGSAGGHEGNGGGNGCCGIPVTASTTLIDPTTDPTF